MVAPRSFLAASGAAALAALMGLASPARAATITSTVPCVASLGIGVAPTLRLAGTGFTPNAPVAIRTSSPSDPAAKALTTVTANALGVITTAVDPPAFNNDATLDQKFKLLAVDTVNPATTAESTFRQVRFGFDAKPSTGRPDRRVTYTARGLPAGRRARLRALPPRRQDAAQRARRPAQVALRDRLQADAAAADGDPLRHVDDLHGPEAGLQQEHRAAGAGLADDHPHRRYRMSAARSARNATTDAASAMTPISRRTIARTTERCSASGSVPTA